MSKLEALRAVTRTMIEDLTSREVRGARLPKHSRILLTVELAPEIDSVPAMYELMLMIDVNHTWFYSKHVVDQAEFDTWSPQRIATWIEVTYWSLIQTMAEEMYKQSTRIAQVAGWLRNSLP